MNNPSKAASVARELSNMQAMDPSLDHRGVRSLSTIAFYGSLLGIVSGISISAMIYLVSRNDDLSQVWRLPFFITALCVFHFLEFYTTARYNTPVARVSSYLLFSANGWAWNVAHACAILEILLVNTMLVSPTSSGWYNTRYRGPLALAAGLIMVVGGQAVRTRAMAVAGTNFNHNMVRTRSATHVLVKHDVYGWFRHPSYFGFYWWAVGTQIVAGNVICAIIYAAVLWLFFRNRIEHEERLLIGFFGADYIDFKRKTGTGIPYIQ